MNNLGYKTETQSPYELDLFLDFLVEKKVRLYAEIGVYAGSTFFDVYKTLRDLWSSEPNREKFTMIAVEMPSNQNAFAHLTSVVLPEIRKDPFCDLHFFVGNSTEPKIVEQVSEAVHKFYSDVNHFDNKSITESLVFIDGDHSYRQARDDYRAYESLFGFVAFNDISPRTVQKQLEKHGKDVATVYHLFDGLTLERPLDTYVEFEDTNALNPRGIGILL